MQDFSRHTRSATITDTPFPDGATDSEGLHAPDELQTVVGICAGVWHLPARRLSPARNLPQCVCPALNGRQC